MRIAYLISAYTQPRAFVNIIRALQAEDVDFYIHIDKKVSMEPFSASLSDMDNVHFVSDENRVKIYWGGVFPGRDATGYAGNGICVWQRI